MQRSFRILLAGLLLCAATAYSLTFTEWQAANFTPAELADPAISGPNVDPDSDSYVNLAEYAHGLTPTARESFALTLAPGPDGLSLAFPQRIGTSDLVYRLEESSDLITWRWLTPNEGSLITLSANTTTRTVSFLSPNAPASPAKWFMRVRSYLTANSTTYELLAPTGLTATLEEPFAVVLGWNDNAEIEQGFDIERKTDPETYELLAEIPPDRNTYRDEAVFGDTTYTYRVSAYDSDTLSAPTNEITITLPLDSDGDGLSDQSELTRFLTDPFDPDSDNDGLPDGWEVRYGFNPNTGGDQSGDADTDGLTNGAEFLLGTNPTKTDSDNNGVPDSQEDADGDGLPNGWEITHGLNPIDGADGSDDLDGDKISNTDEFASGTPADDYFNGTPPYPVARATVSSDAKSKVGFPSFIVSTPPRIFLQGRFVDDGATHGGTSYGIGTTTGDTDPFTGAVSYTYQAGPSGNGTLFPFGPGNILSVSETEKHVDAPNGKDHGYVANEYTTSLLIEHARAEQNLSRIVGDPAWGSWNVSRTISPDETSFHVEKTTYKFGWPMGSTPPDEPWSVKWLIAFLPKDLPETTVNESESPVLAGPFEWSGSGEESTEFSFDPYNATTLAAAQPACPQFTSLSSQPNDEQLDGTYVLLPVEIMEVSFGGTKYWELWADDCGATNATQVPADKKYSEPQWKDVDGNGKPTNTAQGERDYAVAFTRNTKPQIGAKFKISSASNFGAIKIKATGPGGLAIPETAATVSGDEVTLPLTEASSALVNTIKFYDKKDEAKAFKLEWELKIGNSDWSKIGTTKHTVYVTLADPAPMLDFNGNSVTLRQESLFDLGCRNADGETDQASVTTKIIAVQNKWDLDKRC